MIYSGPWFQSVQSIMAEKACWARVGLVMAAKKQGEGIPVLVGIILFTPLFQPGPLAYRMIPPTSRTPPPLLPQLILLAIRLTAIPETCFTRCLSGVSWSQGGGQSEQTIMIMKGHFVTRPCLQRPVVKESQSADGSAEWMDTCSTQRQVPIISCMCLNPLSGFADSRQIGSIKLQHPVISLQSLLCVNPGRKWHVSRLFYMVGG